MAQRAFPRISRSGVLGCRRRGVEQANVDLVGLDTHNPYSDASHPCRRLMRTPEILQTLEARDPGAARDRQNSLTTWQSESSHGPALPSPTPLQTPCSAQIVFSTKLYQRHDPTGPNTQLLQQGINSKILPGQFLQDRSPQSKWPASFDLHRESLRPSGPKAHGSLDTELLLDTAASSDSKEIQLVGRCNPPSTIFLVPGSEG